MINCVDKMKHYYEFPGNKYGLPISICVNSFQDTLFHQHKGLELAYVLSGSYIVYTEALEANIEKRQMVAIAPGEIHSIRGESADSVILVIQIEANKLQGLFVNEQPEFCSCIVGPDEELYDNLRSEISSIMTCLFERPQANNFAMLRSALLICELLSRKKSGNFGINNREIEKCIDMARYINSHMNEDIRLEDMAEHLHFSSSYASRFMKKYLGITFSKYLARARIRASLADLVEGKMTVSEISNKYGFPNTKAYTNYFKEFYEVTPNTYRNRFAYSACVSEYDEKNQYMKLEEDTREYISHLIDRTVKLAVDCSKGIETYVGMKAGSLWIDNIAFCISGSNLGLVDSILEAISFCEVIIDCSDEILAGVDSDEFNYSFAEFISQVGTRVKKICFVDREAKLAARCTDMIKLVLAKDEDVQVEFVKERPLCSCERNLKSFVSRILTAEPIDCALLESTKLMGLIGAGNYKTDCFFAMTLMTKMSGKMIFCREDCLVTKTAEKVKILLFNDKTMDDCNRINFTICIQEALGRFVKTEYFAQELAFSKCNETGENGFVSIANRRRLYVKRKGIFGNITETVYATGCIDIRNTVNKNEVTIIEISKS